MKWDERIAAGMTALARTLMSMLLLLVLPAVSNASSALPW